MTSSTTRPFLLVSTTGIQTVFSSTSDIQVSTIGLQSVLSSTSESVLCNIFKSRDYEWNSLVERIHFENNFTQVKSEFSSIKFREMFLSN